MTFLPPPRTAIPSGTAWNRAVAIGLVGVVWFAALAHGAYDLWAGTAVFAGLSVLLLLWLWGNERAPRPARLPFLYPAVLLLAGAALSVTGSFDRNSTQFDAWGAFFCLVAFYLFVNACWTKGAMHRFLTLAGSVVFPMMLVSLHWQIFGRPCVGGVWTLRLGWLAPGLSRTFRFGYWEVPSTLVNSVILAGFLVPWTVYFVRRTRADRRYWIPAAAALLTLALARSFISAIVLAFGLLYPLRLTQIRERLRRSVGLRIGLGAAVVLCAGMVYFKLTRSTWDHSYAAGDRAQFAKAAVRMWMEHPWTGIGFGAFSTAYPFFRTGGLENTRYAHSLLLQTLSETGLAGFLGLAVFLALAWRQVRAESSNSVSADVQTFRAAAVSAVVFALLTFSFEYWVNRLSVALFFAAGFAGRSEVKVKARRMHRVVMAAATVLIAPIWMKFLAASRATVAGQEAAAQGRLDEAAERFQWAIRCDVTAADAYAGLADLHYVGWRASGSRGDLEEASSWMARAIQQRRDSGFLKRWMSWNRILNRT